jgi:hypothetical protein
VDGFVLSLPPARDTCPKAHPAHLFPLHGILPPRPFCKQEKSGRLTKKNEARRLAAATANPIPITTLLTRSYDRIFRRAKSDHPTADPPPLEENEFFFDLDGLNPVAGATICLVARRPTQKCSRGSCASRLESCALCRTNARPRCEPRLSWDPYPGPADRHAERYRHHRHPGRGCRG